MQTIDTGYLGQPEFAAAYLLVDGDRAVFVDNNTSAAVPRLLAALDQQELVPEQVEYLIVTHVHLDHSAGTAAMVQACPNAVVLAHPRAAPHIIDPTRLVASATAVYGADEFNRVYGAIEPVAADRVRSIEDEETVAFGTRELKFLHTRGHANHHCCIVDSATESIYSGDAFGLAYPRLQAQHTFAFPSTSPTDFEPDLARASIQRLVDQQPRSMHLTHFGTLTDIHTAASQLLDHLDFSEALRDSAERSDQPDEALQDYCLNRLQDYFRGQLDALGILRAHPSAADWIALDLELNAQGIAFAANKRRRKATQAAVF
ncbi:MAG: MBL fold metallo-hydrolase [Pseudomonadota bacterium]